MIKIPKTPEELDAIRAGSQDADYWSLIYRITCEYARNADEKVAPGITDAILFLMNNPGVLALLNDATFRAKLAVIAGAEQKDWPGIR